MITEQVVEENRISWDVKDLECILDLSIHKVMEYYILKCLTNPLSIRNSHSFKSSLFSEVNKKYRSELAKYFDMNSFNKVPKAFYQIDSDSNHTLKIFEGNKTGRIISSNVWISRLTKLRRFCSFMYRDFETYYQTNRLDNLLTHRLIACRTIIKESEEHLAKFEGKTIKIPTSRLESMDISRSYTHTYSRDNNTVLPPTVPLDPNQTFEDIVKNIESITLELRRSRESYQNV